VVMRELSLYFEPWLASQRYGFGERAETAHL
jgi:hypothetical protein